FISLLFLLILSIHLRYFYIFVFFNYTTTSEIYTFPYTTLFRSKHVDHTHPDAIISIACADNGKEIADEIYGDRFVWVPNISSAIDRKSTRLNSSHVSISYVVFCLNIQRNRYNIHIYDSNYTIYE